MKRLRCFWVATAIVMLCTSVLLAGQNYDRRFARISYIEGNAVFRHSGDPDWAAASVNTPLQEQDRIYLPINSRAEIEFDDGSFLRMAEDTEVCLVRLDPQLIRVELATGLTTLRFSSSIGFEVDSPSGSVRFLQKGVYRIEVPRDGSLDVSVRKGTAEILRGGAIVRVRRNEAASVPAESTAQARLRPIDNEDGWDSWNDRRDASALASVSRRYIPADVYIGAYELDHWGTWVNIGGYGHCWRPLHVSYGWSPYREGRWVYRPYWGWTWVSYEPWGWLPYHYGRWFYDPIHSWCWLPDAGFGLNFSFRFWSPGLVHFYHHGSGMHWVPLGPRDYYSVNNYYYNINNNSFNTHIQNVALERRARDRHLQNLNIDGAVVSVSEQSFVNGRSGERLRVSANELATRGKSIASLRDIQLQPTPQSRSPRPEVDVRAMGLVDLRRDAQRTDSQRVGGIRPSVGVAVTGEANRQSPAGQRRDAVRMEGRPSGVNPTSGGPGISSPGGRRVISSRETPRAMESEPDRTPGTNATNGERQVPDRRSLSGEGRNWDGSLSSRDRGISRDGTTVINPGRRVIPGEGRPAVTSPSSERDRPSNENNSVSPRVRTVPGETPATESPRPPERKTPPPSADFGNSSGRRVIPSENRVTEPAVRNDRSFGSFGRDASRSGPTPEMAPAPRVRVFTPESQAPRRDMPSNVNPVPRQDPGMDRLRSPDRSPSFSGPAERDRPRGGPSGPAMSAPPAGGSSGVHPSPRERRPVPPQ